MSTVEIAYCIGESLFSYPCDHIRRFTIPVSHDNELLSLIHPFSDLGVGVYLELSHWIILDFHYCEGF